MARRQVKPYIITPQIGTRERFAIHTNETLAGHASPGHPQASYAIECLMDDLAIRSAWDPVEFRTRI